MSEGKNEKKIEKKRDNKRKEKKKKLDKNGKIKEIWVNESMKW